MFIPLFELIVGRAQGSMLTRQLDIGSLRTKQSDVEPVIKYADGFRQVSLMGGAVDIVKHYGAKLDGKEDETDILIQAIRENDAVYIPSGSEYPDDEDNMGRLLFSDTIFLHGKKLFVNGELHWNGINRPAIWMSQASWLEGGTASNAKTGESYVRHFSDRVGSRHGDKDCAILVNRGNSGVGSIENRVRNFVIDGFGIKSAGTYTKAVMDEIESVPESECPYSTGKGLWLLAGGDYGFTRESETYNYMEFVYRNVFENVRINGYADSVMLEAGWLWLPEDPEDQESTMIPAPADNGKDPSDAEYKAYSPNGWVNGNRFDGLWIRNARRNIHLKSPLGDFYPLAGGGFSTTTRLCGECSGNFFNAVDIQTSSSSYQVGLLVEGGNFNQFNIMHWDAKEEQFPLVVLKRGVPNKSGSGTNVNTSSSRNNSVNLTGSNLTQSNGGIVDEYSGGNLFQTSSSDRHRSFFPSSGNGSGSANFIGAVESFWGLGANLEGGEVSVFKLREDGERSGLDRDWSIWRRTRGLLDPDDGGVLNRFKYRLTEEVKGIELEMVNVSPVFMKSCGFVFSDNEGSIARAEFIFYGESGEIIYREGRGSEFGNCLANDAVVVSVNRDAVKKVVIRFFDPVNSKQGKSINLSNIFSTVSGASNHLYQARKDENGFYYGKRIEFGFHQEQQYDPNGSGLLSGFYYPDLDPDKVVQENFREGYPNSSEMRGLGFELLINRPLEVAPGTEVILTDRITGGKVNLYVEDGIVKTETLREIPGQVYTTNFNKSVKIVTDTPQIVPEGGSISLEIILNELPTSSSFILLSRDPELTDSGPCYVGFGKSGSIKWESSAWKNVTVNKVPIGIGEMVPQIGERYVISLQAVKDVLFTNLGTGSYEFSEAIYGQIVNVLVVDDVGRTIFRMNNRVSSVVAPDNTIVPEEVSNNFGTIIVKDESSDPWILKNNDAMEGSSIVASVMPLVVEEGDNIQMKAIVIPDDSIVSWSCEGENITPDEDGIISANLNWDGKVITATIPDAAAVDGTIHSDTAVLEVNSNNRRVTEILF